MFDFSKNYSPKWSIRPSVAKPSRTQTACKSNVSSMVDYDTMSSAASSIDSFDHDSFKLPRKFHYVPRKTEDFFDGSSIVPGAISIPVSSCRHSRDAELCIEQECRRKAWAMHYRLAQQHGVTLVSPADEDALSDLMGKYDVTSYDDLSEINPSGGDKDDMLFSMDF